jgi:ribosome maturation factor RimP
MNLKHIEEIIKGVLDAHELSLFSLRTKKEFGENILEVIVDGKDLSSDHLGVVNETISEKLSEDIFDPNYYLEVSSPGAERPLRNLEEVLKHIGAYVHIVANDIDSDGYLLSITDEVLEFQVNIKGRLKKLYISYNDVKSIRLAIKF